MSANAAIYAGLTRSPSLGENRLMSTAPVRIPITATDETSPAFASAAAQAQGFQRTVEANSGSFREARASAKLFSEEIGLGMNRELIRAIAGSKLLQGALSAALPIGLAIGFGEILAKVPDAISRAADAMMGFDEASKKAMSDAVAGNEAIYKSFTNVAEGYALLAAMHKQQDEAQSKSVFPTGPSSIAKNLLGPAGGLWDYVSTLQSNMAEKQKTLNALTADNDTIIKRIGEDQQKNNDDAAQDAQKAAAEAERAYNSWVSAMGEATKASRAFLDKDNPAQKQIDAINEQIEKWREVANEHTGINAIANQYTAQLQTQKALIEAQVAADKANPLRNLAAAKMPDLGGGASPLYSGSSAAMTLANVQTDQSAAIKAAQAVYDETATAAQKYSETISVLTTLLNQGRISQQQFAAAAQKAGADLDASPFKKYYEELGRDIGKTVEQAMLFQESWSKAFRTLLADIIKLVLELYVFKSLATQFGGANGGFFGALFTGLAGGRASGGPVSGGMSYLVGESGPEIFTPGASGAITPNSGLGGGGPVQVFDMRGSVVSGDVVRRAEMVGSQKASENRAVARAIAVYTDLQARR